MTRKDFVLIAGAVRIAIHPDSSKVEIQTIKTVAISLADALTRTNPRFDRDRFITACMGSN